MQHTPKLKTAYYADPQDGMVLHRYMDEQFVTRFLQDAANNKLTANRHQSWREQDRFGSHNRDMVTLRQPLHRTFYMASCELCCDLLGEPAFDPTKVTSAGMVIRRGNAGELKTWQVREGRAIGWRSMDTQQAELEPDHYRRLLSKKLVQSKTFTPAYSGEQTHPMNATLVEHTDKEGRTRKRTLISGYIPLGGALEAEVAEVEAEEGASSDGLTTSAGGQLAEFQWPFGSWDGSSQSVTVDCTGSLGTVTEDFCGQFSWSQADAFQVNGGEPSSAFVPWLRTLIERFHVHDIGVPENEALRSVLSSVQFYQYIGLIADKPGDWSLQRRIPLYSLLDYIETNQEALLEWFADFDRSQAGTRLPELNTFVDLYLSEAQAQTLREQLVMRFEQAERLVEASLPLPRFNQGNKDIYFAKPFVRYLDDCGCERIVWGPATEPFRVVSVLDPEASRPSVIQLPELADVKRGFAKGVTFLTPKSLADRMEKLSPNLDFEKLNKSNRLAACLGFSISFSIPIITICAMILLMIVLNLLNFIFYWLPYAILTLPRRCR